MGRLEHRVWKLAFAQGGVVLRRQLLAIGLTDRMIEHRVRDRGWRRIKPGVFLFPGFADDLRSRLLGATVALPAVVSHEAAAEIHGLPHVRRGVAVVTVPIRTTHSFPGMTVHQSTDLTPEYVEEVAGLRVTTRVRTVIDLAAVLSVPRLERVVDHCLAAREVSLEELTEAFERLGRRGKPGTRSLRAVLEPRQPGYTAPESELERLLLEVLGAGNLPEPIRQYPLPWRSARAGRADVAYPQARLLIEADGRRWHTSAEAFEADRRRDNLALLAGWRVLRFTWEDLTERPGEVHRMVREALEAGADDISA